MADSYGIKLFLYPGKMQICDREQQIHMLLETII